MKTSKVNSHFKLSICVIWAFFSSLWFTSAQPIQGYAYLVMPANQLAEIQVVDPANPDNVLGTIPLNFLADGQPVDVVISPDGEWIALSIFSPAEQKLQFTVMSIATKEIREVAQGYAAGGTAGFFGEPQNVVWSSDSQYLALNMALPVSEGRDDLEVFIYSLSDSKLTNLTDDEAEQFRIAWSSDSAEIATLTEACPDASEACTLHLERFNISNASHLSSVDISHLSHGLAVIGTSACNLKWSPDGHFLSLLSVCNATLPTTPIELYLLDVKTGVLQNVINSTPASAAMPSKGILRANYETVWYDEQNLLVSLQYRINREPEQHTTFTYNPGSGQIVEANAINASEFAINSTTNQIAILSPIGSSEFLNVESAGNVRFAEMERLSAELRLLTSINNVLSNTMPGCHLAWSPDGATLAYVTTTSGDCADTIQTIVFVDGATGAVQQYVPELGDDVWYTIPIGWIQG